MPIKDKKKLREYQNKWQNENRAKNRGLVKEKARAYRAANLEKFRASEREIYSRTKKEILIQRKLKYAKKVKCRTAVNNAIRDGRLTRENCCICEKLYQFKTIGFAHHTDYNKPLDVMWLCGPHHAAYHKWFHPIPPE